MSKARITIVTMVTLALMALPGIAAARHGQHRRGHSQTTISGTIASFQGGVLTIRMADNTTAKAAVTRATEIECEPAAAAASSVARIANHGGSAGPRSDETPAGRSGDDSAAGATSGGSAGATGDDSAAGRASDDTPAGAGAQAPCDRTALVTGATVARATTRTDNAGAAVFKRVKLAV